MTSKIHPWPARRPAFVLASALLFGLALIASQPSQARERQTTITGAQGRSATRDVTRSQGDVSSSTTGPNGKTSSRVVQRAPGQTQATVTGPNGRQWRRTTQYSRSGSTSSVSGPRGQTATRTTTRSSPGGGNGSNPTAASGQEK